VKQGEGPEKKQASLCSDNVVGGREIKLKESKSEEGHIALGVEVANRVACRHIWVKPYFSLL
jgi:hypothetical protein